MPTISSNSGSGLTNKTGLNNKTGLFLGATPDVKSPVKEISAPLTGVLVIPPVYSVLPYPIAVTPAIKYNVGAYPISEGTK